VSVLQLTGSDAASGFTGADPQASAPAGVVSGSTAGSGLWVVMSQWLADRGGNQVKPDAADLTGLWRTNDVTGCAPAGNLTARVTQFRQDGRSLSGTKVAGDACLGDRATDFRGTVDGTTGQGVAFGSFGGIDAGASGSALRVVVVSSTDVQLIGQAGTLQYTREYQRVSWPGLGVQSKPESGLLGLPTPSEALTTRNIFLTAALWALLLLLVVFPTTLFNSTLEENLDHYRRLVERIRRRVAPRAVTREGHESFWTRGRGLAVYLGAGGLLFSFMQPGWGANTATLVTLAGFLGGLVVANAAGVGAARAHDAVLDKAAEGHFLVAPSTLAVAVLFVLASRLVGFVPGYLYGLVVAWELGRVRTPVERGRIIALASVLRLVAAVLAWIAISGLRGWTGTDPGLLRSLPEAFVAGVFVASIHELTIGLIPLRFLPGTHLKEWSRPVWATLWAAGGLLFILVLLRPGLESAESQNVVGTCLLAAGSSAIAVAFWLYHRQRSTAVQALDSGPVIESPVPEQLKPT
jgi:hypothetical protein